MSTTSATNHIGRKICRIRELRGMKQEALAFELGVSQQAVSNMERSPEIEVSLLAQVAEALGVTPEAIENFDEEAVFNIINNTFTSHDTSTLNAINIHPNFNPLDKLIEAYEENKRLYERLLEAEKAKVEYLERLLKNK
ncbi:MULTISPECIES: helix-turn-helix domain-containing protein [unclassified Sphingobacterium]|uniref:helix-turn-helix domain-containing protein n=1 Tax=unclassified Sphingobacterium TaxID=2609468 RepID=UPI0025FED9E8|nr:MULTISPECIES: helix-turn-helix domain-containing protein [unclassified Sphingobacterium]